MSYFLRFLSSPSSRKTFYTVSFAALGGGTAVATYCSNTFFLNQYAGLFQMYKKGFKVDVTEDLLKALSEVSEDLRVPVVKPPTKLFHIIGYDTAHFGTTMSLGGCLIGVPISFQHKSIKDIEKESIQVDGKGVAWDSIDGEQLLNSLVMSDQAKKYGIAYELALADTVKLVLHTVAAPVSTFVCGIINNFFCNEFALPFRAFPIKFAFYSSLIVFGIGVYFLTKDLATQYCQSKAIKRVSNISQEYVLGGIEFYDKLLSRNKALRNLLKSGASDYNTVGDSVSLFRRKHVPITECKRFLEGALLPNIDLQA